MSQAGLMFRDKANKHKKGKRVPGNVPGNTGNGVSGREEVINVFIVTGGAERAMVWRL